jgi:ABC-type nitrate/sulfonate/bicarbonate transport system ATPase subunit
MTYGYERPAHNLEVKGLTKSFVIDGRPHPVFSGIDMSIERGEFVAIVGESGSGKTTLLRIIVGLEAADAGSTRWAARRCSASATSAAWCFKNRASCPG